MPLSAKEYNHMQVIFDNISDMIFYIEIKENGTFCYKDANKSAIQQLHLPKDFIGKTIHDIMPQDLANTIIYNYQQAIINKDTISFVAPFTDQSRVERQYESKVTPLFHQNDNIDRIIFVTRDISEQQRQENELRRVKRELELTFEHVADALFTFDKNGDYIKINRGYTKLFGWTSEEVLRDPSITILEKNEQRKFKSVLHSLKKGEVKENLVTGCIAKEGCLIKVLASYSPIMDDGKMIGGVAVYKDITQFQQMENRINNIERSFHYVAQHSSDIVRIVNRDGTVVFASPSHQKILDLPEKFFLNKSSLTFTHPEDMDRLQETLETIIRTKASQSVEFRRYSGTKQTIWLEALGTPILDVNGEVENVLFVMRDIQEKKEKESQLRQLAYHDTLTELPNRRLFDEQVTQTMKDAFRQKHLMAVFIIDCDDFKRVNDTYGHDVGDEFLVVLPYIGSYKYAELIAQRIIDETERPFLVGDFELRLTASIGISFYQGEKKTKKTLLEEADMALYEAKRKGKNTFRVYKNNWKQS